MTRPHLSVIIPAYNEATRLPLTLVDVDRHLAGQDFTYEIIVVVSPGTDKTAEMVKRFESFIKNLKVISLAENKGKGFAVRAGMQIAKGTWRLYMDADNSTTIVEFMKMTPYLTDGNEVVIGSRAVAGAHVSPPMPLTRRIISRIGNFFVRLFVLKGIHDTQCGFKCFSARASERIFDLASINGWAFDIELLVIARKLGYTIKEIPVFYAHDSGSHLHARSYVRSLWELKTIWWRLITKRYNAA